MKPLTYVALVGLLIACGPPRNQEPICCEHEPLPPRMTNAPPEKSVLPNDVTPNVADIMIDTASTRVSIFGDSLYTFRTLIKIKPGGNNCADYNQSYAVITLPQQTKVEKVWAISLHSQPRFLHYQQCQGQITVRLDSLCPENEGRYRGNFISVRVRRSPYRHPECQPAFSVHAYSTTPDPDPSNNYWWWRRVCGGGEEDWTPDPPTRGPR